jgi:capsular polysaccharide biosynthesis protein
LFRLALKKANSLLWLARHKAWPYAKLRSIGRCKSLTGRRNGPLKGWRRLRPREIIWDERVDGARLFVAVLPSGRVWRDLGAVVASDGMLIADVSRRFEGFTRNHDALTADSFPPPRMHPGSLAVINSIAAYNYYHWMFDVLPRIAILRRSKVAFSSIFASRRLPFQVRALQMAEIDLAQVIDADSQDNVLCEVDQLIVPSLPGEIGVPTQFSVDWLRDTFASCLADIAPARRFYVTRNDAGLRRVLNETAVVAAIGRFGFELVNLSRLSLDDQVRLFSEADIVTGPHGAGLSNPAFMSDTSRGVIEFMPATYDHRCIEVICGLRRIAYERLTLPSDGGHSHDMTVDIPAFCAVLEKRLA